MSDNPIAREVAEREFERFIEAMDIDADTDRMTDEDTEQFEKQKGRLITAMERGHLTINEDGEAVYTPFRTEGVDPITFHERTGATLIATDTKKKNQQAAKLYAMMADMTKRPPVLFSKMKGADIKTCEAIFSLLMD